MAALRLGKIITPLRQHVQGLGSQRVGLMQQRATPLSQWPALLQVAALRGEAVLRQRFFGAFIDKLPTQTEPAQALAYWQRFVEDGRHLHDLVQRVGLGAAVRAEAAITVSDTSAGPYSRALYCALLDQLDTASRSTAADAGTCARLASLACEAFFTQLWLQQFPQAPSAVSAQGKDIEALRQRLQVALQRKHKNTGKDTKGGASYRESFRTITQADGVDLIRFSLLAKLGNAPWHSLVEVERPRLKTAKLPNCQTAKLAAYQAALKSLKTN